MVLTEGWGGELTFVLADFDEAATGVGREPGIGECLLVELGEGLGVESVLEVLEGEREVEDFDI